MKTVSTVIATFLIVVSDLVAAEQKLVSIEPRTVQWLQGEKAIPKTVRIKTNGKDPVRVLGVSSKSEGFKFQLEEIDSGKEYRVTVTPDGTDKPVLGVLRIETDSKVIQERIQHAFMFVAPDQKK
jgi:hypothetical protein